MKRLHTLFPMLMVALLALASFWLDYIVGLEGNGRELNKRHEPDSVMENFEARQFDQQGQLHATVLATQMFHYPDDDSSELIKPHVTLTGNGGQSVWTSERGILADDNSRIDLSGSVRGERLATTAEPAQTLTTEQLTLLTDDQIGRSPVRIHYTSGKTQIDAVGAEWDQARGLLNLYSQVHATLEHNGTQP